MIFIFNFLPIIHLSPFIFKLILFLIILNNYAYYYFPFEFIIFIIPFILIVFHLIRPTIKFVIFIFNFLPIIHLSPFIFYLIFINIYYFPLKLIKVIIPNYKLFNLFHFLFINLTPFIFLII